MPIEGMLFHIVVDLVDKSRLLLALLPGPGKLVRSSRWIGAGADYSLGWVGHRSEEVGCCLLLGANEAEVLKVGLGLVRPSEVDLTALVQDNDLVK